MLALNNKPVLRRFYRPLRFNKYYDIVSTFFAVIELMKRLFEVRICDKLATIKLTDRGC